LLDFNAVLLALSSYINFITQSGAAKSTSRFSGDEKQVRPLHKIVNVLKCLNHFAQFLENLQCRLLQKMPDNFTSSGFYNKVALSGERWQLSFYY